MLSYAQFIETTRSAAASYERQRKRPVATSRGELQRREVEEFLSHPKTSALLHKVEMTLKKGEVEESSLRFLAGYCISALSAGDTERLAETLSLTLEDVQKRTLRASDRLYELLDL